jgi:apolipoprotein D and lipocalin family protein
MALHHRIFIIMASIVLTGCQSMGPIQTESKVDIQRFMGDWYVIANIPTFIEKNAYNAKESYRLEADGTIATNFTYNKGGFDGPLKTYTPRGFVTDDPSNAVWGMQFIWPVKSEYRIIYLDHGYTTTIIGRTKRDYVWIMARSPSMDDALYNSLLRFLEEQGYDTRKVQKVPHQSP